MKTEKNLREGKALLFINGVPPVNMPNLHEYSLIACSDGAFHYLKDRDFPLEKLDFISGDFDSPLSKDLIAQQSQIHDFEIIYTPDQDKTDFHKALEIITGREFRSVDVFGGSGGEMDHFLGNLTVAFLFKEALDIVFHDEYSTYFFAPKELLLEKVKGKMISLYPFPVAGNIITNGLKWPLTNENLDQRKRIGTRNMAETDNVSIRFETGDVVVFVSNEPMRD